MLTSIHVQSSRTDRFRAFLDSQVLIFLILFTLLIFYTFTLKAQEKRVYNAVRIEGKAPDIDGNLDDPVWEKASLSGDFVQYEPEEGVACSQQTAFQLLYDDNNIYVGIMSYDSEPHKIDHRLTRRDGFDGDHVVVQIDSYNDHRTAFVFAASASGVKSDGVMSNNGDAYDENWDPIWYVKCAVHDWGWAAEMQIPLSQLRFGEEENMEWGLQVVRSLFRKGEKCLWQPVARNAGGWVSEYGTLKGLKEIEPGGRFDVFPYLLARHERYQLEDGNPFRPGHRNTMKAGLDAKLGVSNDLTLDITVNPDFGQVEADPSEVNLSAFETYQQEKRPFFIEGKDILDFQITGGNGGFSRDNLFYSRRIGRRPHHCPDLDEGEFADCPENTSIISAVKLTGKTRHGWSIGLMESVTEKELAEIDIEGKRREEVVEPASNYLLASLSKDFDEGNRIIGGMLTATNRFLYGYEQALPHSAYSGGLNYTQFWKQKEFMITANGVFSHVAGNRDAMLELQESSLRYFQRPDATHVEVDSGRTSMSGHGGSVEIGKVGGGHWQYMMFLTWRSPGLELNDLGYLREADVILEAVYLGYRIYEPFAIFRSFSVNTNHWQGWNFSGQPTFSGGNLNINMQFTNHWSFGTGFNRQGRSLSKTALRGGPMLRNPGGWSNWVDLSSDSRKKLKFSLGGWGYISDQQDRTQYNLWAGISYRPADAVSFGITPILMRNKSDLKYVSNVETDHGMRYVNAAIDQTTFSLSLRCDVNFTPDLSVQYYGQPFISCGSYDDLKYITDARSHTADERYHIYKDDQISYHSGDEQYIIDEDADGMEDYRFDKPDYDFFQFRSNLVLRWEYTPGSVLFLVWSQGRTHSESRGEFSFANNYEDLFDTHPHDVFLIKFSHRIKAL